MEEKSNSMGSEGTEKFLYETPSGKWRLHEIEFGCVSNRLRFVSKRLDT